MHYASPQEVPFCVCRERGTSVSPTLCSYGHLLECHYPLDCERAACSHLTRYEELNPADMNQREGKAAAILGELAKDDCSDCQGNGTTEVKRVVQLPEQFRLPSGNNQVIITTLSICHCISAPTAS